MSIDSARIACTGCDYESTEVYRPIRISYKARGGRVIETSRAKGWCYACADYSDIEGVSKEDLNEALATKERERLEARSRQDELSIGLLSNLLRRPEKKMIQLQIEDLEKKIAEIAELIEIVRNRKSNARCLKCGSDRTVKVRFDPESNIAHNFQHECGGHLQIIHDHSGPRFHFRLSTYILNEEGELLGKE